MSTFYNDVIQQSEYFTVSSRVESLDLLEPDTRTKVEMMAAAASVQGFVIYETYRSSQRQALLHEGEPDKYPTELSALSFGCGAVFATQAYGQVSQDGDPAPLQALAEAQGLIYDAANPWYVTTVATENVAGLVDGSWYPESGVTEPPATFTQPPVNVDVPYVEQVDNMLNCTMGNWNGEPTSYSYQWVQDGSGIPSIGPSLDVLSVPDIVGHSMTCIVTATNGAGSTAAPPSNAVVVEAPAARGLGDAIVASGTIAPRDPTLGEVALAAAAESSPEVLGVAQPESPPGDGPQPEVGTADRRR